MKHAYLIIAHNEFEVLQLLVSALDDVQNDFFIHFDKKVRKLPQLFCQHSRLFVLKNRVDVRWGSVSQIKCEMLLFEEARQMGSYDYYHMISGTHLPLKNVAELNLFFQGMKGYSVLTGFVKDTEYQETLKIHRINLFLRHYASPRPWLSRVSQFVWKSCIASKTSSIPCPVFAETGIAIEVSIPSISSISCLTLSTSAEGKSILFITGIISRFCSIAI